MTAACDEWWLRCIAAEEAFLHGHLLQFCNQLLFQIWVHACTAFTIVERGTRQLDGSQAMVLSDLAFCVTDASNAKKAGSAEDKNIPLVMQVFSWPGC